MSGTPAKTADEDESQGKVRNWQEAELSEDLFDGPMLPALVVGVTT
jgi:hypothetical protein